MLNYWNWNKPFFNSSHKSEFLFKNVFYIVVIKRFNSCLEVQSQGQLVLLALHY